MVYISNQYNNEMKCTNGMKIDKVEQWKWKANNIGDEGAAKISESLMTNAALTELYLNSDYNMIKNICKVIYIKNKRTMKTNR